MANGAIQAWQQNLVGKIHPAAVNAFRLLFDAVQDHDTAIVALNGKMGTATTASAAAATTSAAASSPSTSSSSFPYLADVNQQAGATYATQLTDNGAMLVLTYGAGAAVTLVSTVTAPWFMSTVNLGTANAVFTPSSGQINTLANLPLAAGGGALIYFDGVSFWALVTPTVPATKPPVAHEWIASYDATVGSFTQSQPTVSDVTGAAPIASPTFTGVVTEPGPPILTAAVTATSATAGAAASLPTAPLGYLEMTINGTVVKIPYYSI